MVADSTPPRNKVPFSVTRSRPAIDRFLAAPPYEPCLLLVSPEIETLGAAQNYLQEHYDWTVLSIGRLLSSELTAVAPAKRPRRVWGILQKAVREQGNGPLLCTDVDLLFHPSLKQNPLHLFRDASRQNPLIVLWPGTFEDDILAYGVEEHGHYRTWPHPDLCNHCIVRL